jgi:drug/metabolite transporter (DMT)-like permease
VTGGILFFGNASFNVLAYSRLEGSIVFMLRQLNAVWLFLFGVLVFREIDLKRHWPRLSLGLVLSLIGVSMLILAKV